MDETTNLWNTKTTDLTVKDQLKISAVATAVIVAVPVAFAALRNGADRVRVALAERKFRKEQENLASLEEDIQQELNS